MTAIHHVQCKKRIDEADCPLKINHSLLIRVDPSLISGEQRLLSSGNTSFALVFVEMGRCNAMQSKGVKPRGWLLGEIYITQKRFWKEAAFKIGERDASRKVCMQVRLSVFHNRSIFVQQITLENEIIFQ